MSEFYVMFHTKSNHATQLMVVKAENKADAKSAVREKFSEQVYFLNVQKGN
jgi:hypothetical protein